MFVGAQWFRVVPFALRSGDEFREVIALFGPATFGSFSFAKQAKELVTMSAGLTDRQKMIAEYFADGPHSELPPGHWDLFAQFVSARDHDSVDEDVKLFFALTNAIFDAGIVAWDAKRAFDSVGLLRRFLTFFKVNRFSPGADREGESARDEGCAGRSAHGGVRVGLRLTVPRC